MSLKHIMLGMLKEPHSGYDIKKEFEHSLRNFWQAELSQIYPLLQKMESEELLTSKAGQSDKGPTRRLYKRAAKGKRELEKWLSAGPKVANERIGYLAQVYFLSELKDETAVLAFMYELREFMSNWLDNLKSAEVKWKDKDDRYPDELPDEDFYAQLTLSMGVTKVGANLQWCDESIARIHARRERSDIAKVAIEK